MTPSLEQRLALAVAAHEDDLIALRRHLHTYPELSHHERQTTALLAERLGRLGYQVRERPEGVGLVADLRPPGRADGPLVAIRADLDALPIHEHNDVDYRSAHAGVMHACGHDVHMSCAMGAAAALAAARDSLPWGVRLIYQHAEESSPSGAPDMIAFGALEGVRAIIALHCDPERPAGQVGIRPGPMTASYDRFIFTLRGKAGHGARPHQCIDPIFAGVQLAQALYQVPSRWYDSREAMALSLGTFHAGQVANIIPEEATLSGTVRTVSQERRAQVEPMLRRAAQSVCDLTGATYALDLYQGAPALINDPQVTRVIEQAAQDLLGPAQVERMTMPSMGSEDFAHYLLQIPGAMFRLGTASAQRPVHLLHSPRFDVDERAIALGAQLLAKAAVRLMS